MKKLKARVIRNERIGPDYFLMDLCSEYIVAHSVPGQFIHMRIEAEDGHPFLRRPFSIHSLKEKDTFQILYKVVGRGTEILSTYTRDKKLDILGPLGNGFELNSEKNNLLVAGGMGVAPLFFLTQFIKKSNYKGKTFIFMGAKSKDSLVAEEEFRKLGVEILTCTEDASCGKRGLVTQLLESFLKENPVFKKTSEIFGCGPNSMLKALIELANGLNMDLQVSVEEMFACGVGACLGCAINTKVGYKLACKDGPVFRGNFLIL
jgi:dihydroorotate dehydrogenase electron transfer subunit